MKRLAILGSTGSIGTQALDVVSQFPDRLRVVGLAARRNEALLLKQAADHKVSRVAMFEKGDSNTPYGMQALLDLVSSPEVDVVLVAVSGVIGLLPTVRAIEAAKQIALASKEVLVAAGEFAMPLAKAHGTLFTPVDSEHSAIFQCLQGYRPDQVHRLILTGSGGPFRGCSREQLRNVSVEAALKHPTWRMGGKITVDSATLMNKALELIEAKWLFDIPAERIEVRVHPQSVIHSMVQFKDGSALGQLGFPDMRLPIAYALLYPERLTNRLPEWDPLYTPSLTFEPVDDKTFPSLGFARQALAAGGTMTCALNAANEEAANAFLAGHIGFTDIYEVVQRSMECHTPEPVTLDSVLNADERTRGFARNLMKGLHR